jgi:tetratricopeptide (TPR) repeat protein
MGSEDARERGAAPRQRAAVLMRKTREEQEVHELDELFERYRQAPDSYVFVPLADACRKMGRIEEALEICENGVRRHPGYPSGHVVKGKCLYDRGDRDAARGTFERVLVLDEDNLVALKYLGMIEADEGHLETAERHLQQILSLDPENKEIKSILHLVEEQEQIEQCGEALSADDMDVIEEILGDTAPEPSEDLVRRDEWEPATPVEPNPRAGGSDEIETSDELASVTLADIFASQGYTSKAEKIYCEVLRKQPGNEVVRRRLRELLGETPVLETEVEETEREDASPQAEEPLTAESELKDEGTPPGPPADAGSARGSAPAAESVEEHPALTTTRPAIDEKNSLGHFKRWLTRLQK